MKWLMNFDFILKTHLKTCNERPGIPFLNNLKQKTMELSVKHLAPYLPYGLMIYGASDIWFMCSIGNGMLGISNGLHSQEILLTDLAIEYKIGLRPLSTFTEECYTNLQSEFMRQWCDAYTEYFNIWFNDAANVDKLIFQCPQEIFDYFLENHYDVFGLIPAGLAIEII